MMRDLGYWMLAMFQNRSGTCYRTVMVGSDRAYRARPVSHRWRAAARGVTFVQHIQLLRSCITPYRSCSGRELRRPRHDVSTRSARTQLAIRVDDDSWSDDCHVGDTQSNRLIISKYPVQPGRVASTFLHYAPYTLSFGVPFRYQASYGRV